jgi:Zn-dependent peptidase ImmA (M78 family)/plasmid maintenance system antidote protein VapI
MEILKIIGGNIRKLMDAKGVSMRTLARMIDVSHPTLSSYISGERAIDSGKLYKLAEYFNVDFDYFLKNTEESHNLMFRVISPATTFTENDKEKIMSKIDDYLRIVGANQLIAYIPQQYSFIKTAQNIKDIDKELIKRVADEQRRLFGIEDRIPENYYKLLEDHNINIFAFPHENAEMFGCSFFDDRYGSLIYVNTNEAISEERQLFSLIHEYAHLLFHRDQYLKSDSDFVYKSHKNDMKEKMADMFAGYFLMPPNLLYDAMKKDEFKTGDGKTSIMLMKKHFQVSYYALVVSLKNSGILKGDLLKTIFAHIYQQNYDRYEPLPMDRIEFFDKNRKILNIIKKMFANEDITLNKIVELFGISNREGRRLVGKWNDEFNTAAAEEF